MAKLAKNGPKKRGEKYILPMPKNPVLDLLHLILDLQVNLRPLKMVPNDSPGQKTWGLTPKPCL